MAYAAVVSLKETIQRLQNSSDHIISPQIIESAYDAVLSLQDVLKGLDSSNNRGTGVNVLDEQIKETICELEHVLESHVSNTQSESHPSSLALDVDKVNADVDSFIQSLRKLEVDYATEAGKQLPEEEDDGDDDASPRIEFGGKMVGVDEELGRIQYYLLNGRGPATKIVNLIGMAGIGKTALARELFEDQSISEYFDLRVWVTVGPKYHLEKILHCILAQVNLEIDKSWTKGDMEQMVFQSLMDRRLLIVFDDVWGKKLSIDLKKLLPPQCESGVMLTTRSKKAAYIESWFKYHHYMEPLNNEESWTLLRHKVFGGDKSCPTQLEKAGRKIAENCEGLPLTIVIVADILSTKEKTPGFWDMVAEKQNSVFKDAYDQMSKVLLPSYKYLPQHLKACFLYLAVFPPNFEIPCSKLFMLWIAEGFLERDPTKTLEDIAMECLNELEGENVILVLRKSHDFGIKTCSLHSVFWHLCNREARKIRFSHIMNTRADGSAHVLKSQRRLCVHNNVLFGIGDVHNSMASVPDARSLLCTGPRHQYPVPVCFGLKLLKILDALTVRFYEFPIQVLKLTRLKYLALTCNENVPTSISQLWNLQCLIVNKHTSIKSSENPSNLPIDIWDIKELKHLHVMGSDLLDPRGALLPNLLTLVNVGTNSCTKSVLRGTPNLKKLGVRIELGLDDVTPLSFFYHISRLHELESLKCVVVNPKFKPEVVSAPPRLPISSSSLKKLTLSGFGYPWECIKEIEALPVLQVLKLKNYAFRGPKWETRDDGFPSLKVLLIEDSDLVQWTAGCWSFSNVEFLTLKNCYKLQEMPREFGDLITTIRVVDCSPFTEKGAKHIRYDQLSKEIGDVDIYVHSSWKA
ncbi:putative late blight resistance protein homolog r1a-6 [Phtheirospermum japonicum]|uniref:Putative late blight resistance protein homolog r1a-6 n=1 Tax=Phtheirospermum japonicum TaxID=374723 RepID=A0A830CUS6_9LAMI|nr:putative late blight resistance protein homolog r1a-6 [Phtheirospermum japonicum]